jgi:hypothetical protein
VRFLICILIVFEAVALELPPQFSSNMVLQRGVKNRFWGMRPANSTGSVWVQFQSGSLREYDGSSKGPSPYWQVLLPKIDSSNPGTITIWEGDKKQPGAGAIVFTNVLVGDVWILAVRPQTGFSSPPGNIGAAHALSLPEATDLVGFAPPNVYPWTPLDNQQPVDVLAGEILSAFRKKTPTVPLGIIVVPFSGLENVFPLGELKEFARSYTNEIYRAGLQAIRDVRAQFSAASKDQIKQKHAGKLSNAYLPKSYGDFTPYLKMDYPRSLQSNEWGFKGLILPLTQPRP